MTITVADRVMESTTNTGTGTFQLNGATGPFTTFILAIGSGKTTYYTATDGTGWEVGYGVVTSGSPNTLTRAVVLASSNGGALMNFANPPSVWCDYPALKSVFVDTDGSVPISFLRANGLLTLGYVRINASYSIGTDQVNIVDVFTPPHTITLPSATTAGAGRQYTIRNGGPAGSVTVNSAGGTIDSLTTYIIAVARQSITVESDGINWILV